MAHLLTETDRSLFQAVGVVRWLTLAWAAVGVAISTEHFVNGVAAWLLIALAAAVTIGLTVLHRQIPERLASPVVIVVELVTAAALLVGDGYVYADTRPQSLPWAWPAAGLIACGIAFGQRKAVAAAIGLGLMSFIGEGLNDGGSATWGVTASSKTGLYVLAALVSGYVAHRMREAEIAISAAKAREEVAATLHDGVLQTLAVVQRRSHDPELVALAHDQDRDLRAFLAGTTTAQPGLSASLHDAAARFEQRTDSRAEVVIADDVIEPADAVIAAVAGAVGEALANVAKHADASRVVIYVEPDDEATTRAALFVSVKDDGVGFDPEAVTERIGMQHSIRSRVESVGGRVEVASRPGRGTEVRLWVP